MKRAMVVVAVVCSVAATAARSASTTLPAGQTMELKEDLVLSGGDNLVIEGSAEKPCTLVGNGRAIRTQGTWTGQLKLTYCTIKGVGQEPTIAGGRTGKINWAIDLAASGTADITIDHCTFDASGSVQIINNDRSTAAFRNNTAMENVLARTNKDTSLCSSFFVASGKSPAPKFFQGNRIYKSNCWFSGSVNWVIGGDSDAEGNIFIGQRTGVVASGSTGTVIRHNYFHMLLPVTKEDWYWSQAVTLAPAGDTSNNVVRSGHWIVQSVEGEFHHNLVLEVHGHNWMRIGKGKVHHNIFAHNDPAIDRFGDVKPIGGDAGIFSVYKADSLEVYNNTLDGNGVVHVGIDVDKESFMPSLRNNVFYRFERAVGPCWSERYKILDPLPPRLGYVDYNCFYNPGGKCDNYAMSVAGKKERMDDGFARHDLPSGGNVDEQCDPKFKGPLEKFPFADEDVKSGKVTISQILKFYRDAYTPLEGSPLLKAGDPADGEGTDIGAVQVSPVKPAK